MISPKTERGPIVLFLEGGYFHQSTGLDRTEQNMAVISFAKAVEYMHGRGVVHGDIQPENVLLTGKCECKISIAGAVRSHEIGLLQTPAARSVRYWRPR
jgi:tRNA A-37 threonylcarbamoyl transferase component Bud32